MKKLFDTNVLIDHPEIVIENSDIVIPFSVLDELENLKRRKRLNYKARKAIRNILNHQENIEFFDDSDIALEHVDDILIEVALLENLKLYTKDVLLYLRGQKYLEDIEYYTVNQDMFKGVKELRVSENLVTELYDTGFIKADKIDEDLLENEYVDLGRVIAKKSGDKLFKVDWEEGKCFISRDFKLNRRQLMAHDLLLDTTTPLIAIWGKYGTGKTSLSVRTAINMFNKDMYQKILVTRPKVESGFKEEHLGTLPGEVDEKYNPFLKPFEDNATANQFKMFEVQPLSTIKGRDIKDTLFIVDEAQDIPPERMPMLVERIGKGSKMVLLGDPKQIDNSSLNKHNNGLTFTVNALKGKDTFGCVQLLENERSQTAMLGEDLRECLL